MRQYLAKSAAVSLALLFLHFLIVAFVPSPIRAEYWVREAIIVKRYLAGQLASPKLIFLGGSNVLFGIDARQIERELGVPAINYGLHGCLHFNVLAGEADRVAQPGDILVMPIEQPNYTEERSVWTDCQLRNTIAWGSDTLEAVPIRDRLRFAFISGWPSLSIEIIAAKIGAFLCPSLYKQRLDALVPANTILARYASGALRTSTFVISAYNLSDRGDITNAVGARYKGAGVPVISPGAIFPETKTRLTQFVQKMRDRGVRVVIAHAPYLLDGSPSPNWRRAEDMFAADVKDTGAELLDRRDELFLPRADFFNTLEHLNETGRQVRTERLLANLRGLGIGKPQARAVTTPGSVAK